MQSKHYLISALTAIFGFVAGFMLANSLNRYELQRVAPETGSAIQTGVNAANQQKEMFLSPEEIRSKIKIADDDPKNLHYQKSLGTALYRYAAMRQDTELIAEGARLLERASELDPSDTDTRVALGNAYFDIGYFKKDNDAFARSRGQYETALKAKPDDVDLRTDIALTYFLFDPPDLEKAAAEFERSLAIDPKHGKTLNFYIQTLAKQNRRDKAKQMLVRLREVSPNEPSIPQLAAMIDSPRAADSQ